jgi:TrwC relaxase
MHGCRYVGGGRVGLVALPVKALKAGQESYWLDQIARNREEYFSGRGESPGRFVGSAAHASGLEGIATAKQVRAMFQGLDPATGEVRCAPLWRADPRSKLTASPLLEALKTKAAKRGVEDLEQLAGSKALKGDVRAVQAACRQGGSKRVKVETVERLCRKVLDLNPASCMGKGSTARGSTRASGSTSGCNRSTTAFPAPRVSPCWPPAAATTSADRSPKRGRKPSRWASATWSGTGSGCGATTTAPTATRPTPACWRWRSSIA